MRKFWIVLLSVGLIVALTAPVLAADVKFSGSYIIQGYYEDNRQVADIPGSTLAGSQPGPSYSLTWQRLRVGTEFQVAEGLKLTTRFDAMEKVWGAPRMAIPGSGYAASYDDNGYQITGSGEAENIKFQHVYMTFNTGIGRFLVGYQAQTAWGTSFGDSSDIAYGPRARWDLTVGPSFFGLIWDKYEGKNLSYPGIGWNSPNANTGTYQPSQVDDSKDKYSAFYVYNWSKGNTGLLIQYAYDTSPSGPTATGFDNGYKKYVYLFDPYIKATMGPVYFEAEAIYVTGKLRVWENGSGPGPGPGEPRDDLKYSGLSLYAMAKVDLKPVYVGGAFVYISGDDAGKTDTVTAGIPGGADFNPCLIMGNYDLNRWAGYMGNMNLAHLNTAVSFTTDPLNNPLGGINGVGLENVWAYQIFAGVTPVPKLDVKVSLTYAYLDKTPSDDAVLAKVYAIPMRDNSDGNWISKNLGWEGDVTATYKIYDNLSWMLGFGYLWAGDAFKGTNPTANIKNDYLLTHKLTLTF